MSKISSRRLSGILLSLVKHAFLILMSLVSIYPVLWVVSTALTPGETLAAGWHFVLGLIPVPNQPTLDHFIGVLTASTGTSIIAGSNFVTWAENSGFITVTSVIGTLALTLPAGYAFSRRKFLGQQAAMFSFLLPTMLPGIITIIPQYLLFSTLGLVDTYWGVIIPYMVGSLSLSIFIMKSSFDSIPKDLDEAAVVDGASERRVFWQILLPLTLPSIATVALWAFMGAWLDFALAHVILVSSSHWTLPLALYQYIQPNYTYYGTFAAFSLIMAIPVFVVFMVFQKYLVSGLTAGAVKG
jgi:arabinogalactan oligomer/maltooligosaccharide transport system permease protein